MKRGLTLTELLLTVIIVSIVAALALPNYNRYVEKNRGREAETNLMVIYNAEKRYKLDNGAYYICSPDCNITGINDNLTLSVVDTFFNYTVSSQPGNGFIAVATRRDRDCGGKVMNITDRGGPVQKECPSWQ